MNKNKFFEICKQKGITQSQLQITKSTSFSVGLFRGEIENYSVDDTQQVLAAGIINGKTGYASTSKFTKDTFEYLSNTIIESAKYNEKDGLKDLFKGSEKYHKKNVYNPALSETPATKKIAILKDLEKAILSFDKRIVEAPDIGYTERTISEEFYNSLGLKLKQKSNYFYLVGSAVGKQDDETKNVFEIFLDQDITKVDVNELAKKIGTQLIAKFGGAPCDSGKYPTILKNDVFAELLMYFLEAVSSEEVQKHTSLLEGKLGQKIASSKLTIDEKPLTKNIFFSYFDSEGVAAQNKSVVKKGVLQTYFYNRETAAKEGRESTGNGVYVGGKIGVGFSNIFVKPGKTSFDDLVKQAGDGVYITDLAGLGTGMNARSGDFSCQAQGFLIENGKITKPLTLITLSGNLLKMLKDIKAIDNRDEQLPSAIKCPDVLIKKMSIGGK